MFLERKKCPACLHLSFSEIYLESYNKGAIKKHCIYMEYDLDILKNYNYSLVECDDCGLLFQKNVPNEELLDLIYNKWLSKNQVDIHDLSFNPYTQSITLSCINEINRIVSLFNKPVSDLRFLDFGMGWGQLCQIAKCMGMDVYGIDHSPANIDYAKKCGIKTVDIKEIKNMEFDFINTDQVFEHLTDPLGELRLLEKGLAQNGIIKIAVPRTWFVKRIVRQGVRAELFNLKGTYFTLNSIAPLQHLNGFNRRSIVEMGKRAGLVKLREPALNIWKNSVRVISPKNLIKTYLKPISRYVDIYTLLIKL